MEQSPPIGQGSRLLLQGGAGGYRPSPFEGIMLLLFLAIAMFIGYSIYARANHLNAKPPAASTYLPAFRITLTSTVSATGTVSASQQVTLTFDRSGGVGAGKIAAFMAGLGDQVVTGQALAKIDDTDLIQAQTSAESALASSQARLNAVISPSPADIASASQSISSAQSQVATAQKNLDDLQTGPTAGDRAAAQQSVLTAQNSVITAQTNLTRAQNSLFSDQQSVRDASDSINNANIAISGAYFDVTRNFNPSLTGSPTFCPSPPFNGGPAPYVPSTCGSFSGTGTGGTGGNGSTATSTAASNYAQALNAYAAARAKLISSQGQFSSAQQQLTTDQNSIQGLQASVQTAQSSVTVAQQKYNDLLLPPTASQMDAVRASLDAARASQTSAEARYNALLRPTPDVVLPLQANVDSAAAALATAQKNVKAGTIVAPFDGLISQVTGDVGTQVQSNTPVFILLNPKLVRIDANVDQAYVNDLRAGQIASVTFDAIPGRTYQSTVSAIGLTPTVQQGVVSYVVTLGLDTSRLASDVPVPKPGMTAAINVTTSRTENALVVPTRSIRRIGRNQNLTVKKADGTDELRAVTTGATNGTLIQITSGLTDGDQVLVSAASGTGARPATSGTARPATFP